MKTIMKTQKGAAMVEFVIVLPFLLMLTFGIIEFGNALMKFNALNKMTMDAARYLSIYQLGSSPMDSTDPATQELLSKAQNLMNCGIATTTACPSNGYFPLGTAQTLNATINNATGLITVTVTYNYVTVLDNIFGTGINLLNAPLTSTIVVQAIS